MLAALALALVAATPSVSIDDVTTQETNFDTSAVLTITLAPASSETVTVAYRTVDGTADSTDYVPESGFVTFAPGGTTFRLPITIKGDALDESDETFSVELVTAQNAGISRARGTVTIVDDIGDRVPTPVIDATVRATWSVHRTYTRVKQLVVKRVPATASIDVGCSGQGCPFRFAQSTRRLEGAKLRPGARVQVTVDAPGQIGKRFSFRIRAGKQPLRTVAILD
jgi:Calx-beta domain